MKNQLKSIVHSAYFLSHLLFLYSFTYLPLTFFIKMLALVWEIRVKMEEHALKEWLLASSYAGAEKDTMGKLVKVCERFPISFKIVTSS